MLVNKDYQKKPYEQIHSKSNVVPEINGSSAACPQNRQQSNKWSSGFTRRIEYKLLSLTYKVLTTNQPPYLHQLISVQPPRSTRSSALVILARPPTSSSLRITDRSFRYASPCLWNQLPSSLRQLRFSPSVSVLPVHAPTTSSHSVNSPLLPSITPSLFHSRLKTSLTNLSHHRLPSSLRTDSTDFTTGPFLLSISVFCF